MTTISKKWLAVPIACTIMLLGLGVLIWSGDESGPGNTNYPTPVSDPAQEDYYTVKVVSPVGLTDPASVLVIYSNNKSLVFRCDADGIAKVGRESIAISRTLAFAEGHISSTSTEDISSNNVVHTLEKSATVRVHVVSETGDAVDDARIGLEFQSVRESEDWSILAPHIGVDPSQLRADSMGTTNLAGLKQGQKLGIFAEASLGISEMSKLVLEVEQTIALSINAEGEYVETVCLEEKSNVPVTNTSVIYKVFSKGTKQPTFLRESATTTDSNGKFRIPLFGGHFAVVTSIEGKWVLGEKPVLLTREGSPNVLYVSIRESIKFLIKYEDGTTYENGLSVVSKELQTMVWTAKRYSQMAPRARDTYKFSGGVVIIIDKNGSFTLQKEYYGKSIRLTGDSKHGFQNLNRTVNEEEINSGKVIKVVIPKLAPGTAKGRFVFSVKVEKLAESIVEIQYVKYGRLADRFNLDERNISKRLEPGPYTIKVSGQLAWQSEELTLTSGDDHVVTPELAPSGSVEMTVVNKDGHPIAGALLSTWSKSQPSGVQEAIPYVLGVSDSNGVVELAGQYEGQQKLMIVATGFQHISVEVEIFAGEKTNIGKVVLSKARGVITVVLDDEISSDALLRAEVKIPSRWWKTYRKEVVVDGGTHTFDSLAINSWYIVSLYYSKGDDKRQIHINLIELDDIHSNREFHVKLEDFNK